MQNSSPQHPGTKNVHVPETKKPDDTPKLREEDAKDVQVAVPDEVDVPLPKEPVEGIAVPASINGRDLSRGRP